MDSYTVKWNAELNEWVFIRNGEGDNYLLTKLSKEAMVRSVNTWFKAKKLQGIVSYYDKDGNLQDNRNYPRAYDPPWTLG